MGIRFTGISTPIGGLEWEYTDKKEHVSSTPLSTKIYRTGGFCDWR